MMNTQLQPDIINWMLLKGNVQLKPSWKFHQQRDILVQAIATKYIINSNTDNLCVNLMLSFVKSQ